jgi:hypothetical protein
MRNSIVRKAKLILEESAGVMLATTLIGSGEYSKAYIVPGDEKQPAETRQSQVLVYEQVC